MHDHCRVGVSGSGIYWTIFKIKYFPTSFGNQHILFRTLPLNMSDLIIFPTRFSSINIIHPESGANVTYLCNSVSDSRWWPPLVGSVPLPRMIYKGNCKKKQIYKTKLKKHYLGVKTPILVISLFVFHPLSGGGGYWISNSSCFTD